MFRKRNQKEGGYHNSLRDNTDDSINFILIIIANEIVHLQILIIPISVLETVSQRYIDQQIKGLVIL